MKANNAKRLKELEGENSRLKRLLAEAELDKAMLKEIAKGNSDPEPHASRRVTTDELQGGRRDRCRSSCRHEGPSVQARPAVRMRDCLADHASSDRGCRMGGSSWWLVLSG
jgi:hypothetical protein